MSILNEKFHYEFTAKKLGRMGIFSRKSKKNGLHIHDNQGTNFHNGLKWPHIWVVLETELKLYKIHVVKGVFSAKSVKIWPKFAQKRPWWSILGLN